LLFELTNDSAQIQRGMFDAPLQGPTAPTVRAFCFATAMPSRPQCRDFPIRRKLQSAGEGRMDYPTPPDAATLDIDDTVDVVHGHQQLSPITQQHGDGAARPGKTPSGLGIDGQAPFSLPVRRSATTVTS
jgi:hypothetical protein